MGNYSLDRYQQKAVKSEDRNALVIAAPGSGKTTTIINRVSFLIKEKRINPDNIIVITFTRAAAMNMKERFLRENQNIRAPFFGTFHGLFYRILKREGFEFDIVDGRKVFGIVKGVLCEYIDEGSEEKVKEILNNISLMKTGGYSIQEMDLSIDTEIFKECYERYEQYKKVNNLMDFDDLQINCKNYFLKNEIVLNNYRRLFKHILVDEFQDCDMLQIELLKMLNIDNNIYAVGDEDQCIYGFRGSRPDCMIDFDLHFKEGVKLYLSNNYRSPKNIVESSEELIKHNKMRNEKKIQAVRDNVSNINILKNPNEKTQAHEISNAIFKLRNINGYEYSQNAVLYRTNIESRSIIDALIRKKIPFKLLDKKYNFFQHFICRDIISYLQLSIDPGNKEAFRRIINKPFRYISKNIVERIANKRGVTDCFEELKNCEEIHPFQLKNIDNLKRDIMTLNKYTLSSSVQTIIGSLGYHEYLQEYCNRYKFDLEEMEEIINEFKEASSEFKTILSFLVHVSEVEEQMKKNNKNNEEDSVILSTIHGVKGMEFKNVFIMNCNEDIIPHSSSVEKNLEEERRLFYVAVTRTIDNLWISFCDYTKGKTSKKSRFIDELNMKRFVEDNSYFKQGDTVHHKSFGAGIIKNIDMNNIEIKFEDGEVRKFDSLVVYNNGLITLEK